MAYYFMLGVVPLPITPSALTIKTPSMNKTINLINEGEINIPKDQGLREISFEFLLPTVQKYPFANYQLGSYTATTMIPLLNEWKKTKLPFQFIVTRMSPKGKFLYFTSIKCLIEDFEYKEDAEEYGMDTMCSITLKEYKPYGTKRVKLEKSPDGKPGSKRAKVTTTRDSSSKVKKPTITTGVGETIISAALKNGDSILQTCITNGISIPESIMDYASDAISENSWMGEILPGVDLGSLEVFQETKNPIMTDTNIFGDKRETSPDGFGLPSNYQPLPSLAEAILEKPKKTTYASPTPPANYGIPLLGGGVSDFIKVNKVLMGL